MIPAAAEARGDRLLHIGDPASECAASGRGLRLVEAYAERWGVDEAPANGKMVWAEVKPAPDRMDR